MSHTLYILETVTDKLNLQDRVSIEMRLDPGGDPEFYLQHPKLGSELKVDNAQQAIDELEYLYDEILKKPAKVPEGKIKIFFKRAHEKAVKLAVPPEPPPPPPARKGSVVTMARILQPAFEIAKKYNKAFIVKQRADLGPLFTRSKRLRTVNWQLKYFISFGYVKEVGVFLTIELRGKGRKPKKVFFKTAYQGLDAEEMADQLQRYNVRLKELKPFLDFAAKKKGRLLKGLKPGKDPLTKHQKVKGKAALRARQRQKVPGKDVPMDEPVDVKRFRTPDEPDPTHQFHRTYQGRQRFGSELSSPSADTAKKPDDAPSQEKHKLTQKQADYSYKYFPKIHKQKAGSRPSKNYLVCLRCKHYKVNLKGKKVGIDYKIDTKDNLVKPWEKGALVIVPGRRFLTGLCEVVRGDIHPMATCKLWAPKTMGEREAKIDLAGKVYAALMDFYGDEIEKQEKEYFGESDISKPTAKELKRQYKEIDKIKPGGKFDPELLRDFAITLQATGNRRLIKAGKQLLVFAEKVRNAEIEYPDTSGMDPKRAVKARIKAELRFHFGMFREYNKIIGNKIISWLQQQGEDPFS